MNRFLTKSRPQTKKVDLASKRSVTNENQNDIRNDGTSTHSSNFSNEPTTQKTEETSLMAKLHLAIRTNDAQFTFDTLSKNRPFDNAMNMTMTKMEFNPGYSDPTSEFMLLSVDESVIDAFKEGQSLTVRGESTDEAVLCTDNTTYPMKIIESATTVLLLNNSLEAPASPTLPNFQVEKIDGKCYATGELCPPFDVLNIGRLKDMLREQELRWDWKDKEDEERLKGYSLRELLDSVQMSVGEVKTALADLPVVKHPNGKYRYLSHKFRGELLGLIVELLDEDSIEEVMLERLSFDGLRKHLPVNVPDQVVKWFLTSRCEKISDENVDFYRLPEVNLIRDLTVVILFGPRKMALHQFNDLLTKILPFGIEVKNGIFEGIADVSDASFGKVITYLGPEDLPDTIKERMLYLFEYRQLWTMEQLRPYFKDVYKSKVAFDKYVVQNCDYSLSDQGEMFYCGVR